MQLVISDYRWMILHLMIITFAWTWMTHGYVSVVRILKMLTITFSNVRNTKVSDEFCYNLCKISCQTAYIVPVVEAELFLCCCRLGCTKIYRWINVHRYLRLPFNLYVCQHVGFEPYCSFSFTYESNNETVKNIKKRNSATTFPEPIITLWQGLHDSWICNDGYTRKELDHILINDRSFFKSIRVFRGCRTSSKFRSSASSGYSGSSAL